MEISVPLHTVNTQNIYFSDKKKNVIVEGDFIKIIYSTGGFEMNGLYILFEVLGWKDMTIRKELTSATNWTQIQSRHKRMVPFDTSHVTNAAVFNRLCEIEKYIVDRYIKTYCPLKTPTYALKTQLQSGIIRCHSEQKDVVTTVQSPRFPSNPKMHTLGQVRNAAIIEGISEERNMGISIRAKTQEPIYSVNPWVTQPDTIKPFPVSYMDIIKRTAALDTTSNERFLLKISGVWETSANVGITIKFILVNQV